MGPALLGASVDEAPPSRGSGGCHPEIFRGKLIGPPFFWVFQLGAHSFTVSFFLVGRVPLLK